MPSNRLIHEKSPYLQQHAHNPVDWYPWGEEAFAKARNEDKPIFLSIGYSTCHWCHVMERESFENEATAELVNRWFVPIKVDREERPDIDHIYMTYVQATTGGGGWPMSVWLTPDLEPFVGGTYFPPDNRYGRAGFPVVLERIASAWKSDRAKILESSAAVMEQLRQQAAPSASGAPSNDARLDAGVADHAFNTWRRGYDAKLGGFGGAPKFPRPSIHNFLLRYWKRTGHTEALDMVVETLLAMEKGGMHDQLGGGFHRYSVDEAWFVPHFEKMLYDQAQLAASYLEAFQITGDETLAGAARGILDYVLRDMTAPEGAFYCAEDADSAADAAHPHEKAEGAFYVWSWSEIEQLLGEERATSFAYRYGVERDGNVASDPHHEFAGKNILFAAHTVAETAGHFGKAEPDMAAELHQACDLLFAARAARPRPHLDDKILTAWNGLMITALAKGGMILDEARYTDAAARAADFLLARMRRADGILLRRYRDGDAAIEGMLDDYAFFAQGLLDLYEATFRAEYLESAIAITDKQGELLGHPDGGFYSTAHEDAVRLVRSRDDYDGAEPSGNSVALLTLLRLARITGREDFASSARRLISVYRPKLESSPYGLPQMLAACEFDLAPPREVVVAGAPGTGMTRLLWKHFDPNRILLYAAPAIGHYQPATADMQAPAGGTAIYICENFSCRAPVFDEAALARLLN
jgi:uncharacterized protein YyaL (SSP411 family)